MALQSSGPISLLDIQNEFGGSNPIGLNEYYGVAGGVPASGTISLDDFYGTSSAASISYVTTVGNGDVTASPHTFSSVSLGTTAADRYTVIAIGSIANSDYTATIGGISCTSIVQQKYSGDDSYVGILIADTSSLGTTANIVIDNNTYIYRPGVAVYNVIGLSSASAFSTASDSSGSDLTCSSSGTSGGVGIGIFFRKDNLPGTINFTGFATSSNDASYSQGGTQWRAGHGTLTSTGTKTMQSTAGSSNACAVMGIFA